MTPYKLFKTANGGINWQEVAIPDIKGNLSSLFFYDADNGYISNYGNIVKTTDGGNSWNIVFTGFLYGDEYFITKNMGYFNSVKEIYKTLDGGATWTKEVQLGKNKNEGIIEMHFTDANHGWACGATGFILKYEK